MNQGKLEQDPAAELMREIVAKGLSGALRLSHARAKAVIYFVDGGLVFAASNLRAHRLAEILRRNNLLSEAQLADIPAQATDEELSDLLVKNERLTPAALSGIQTNQVSEILRATLLWTAGEWQFDSRVRIGGDTRVTVHVNRVLLECARHLPADHVASRFTEAQEELKQVSSGDTNLLPPEAFVLSRVSPTITLNELLTISGLAKTETLRAIYGLSLAGLVQRTAWPSTGINGTAARPTAKPGTQPAAESPVSSGNDEQGGVQALFARLETAKTYYEVLDISPRASAEEVKDAYHAHARSYHPDRFHQSDVGLRGRVDSAFAQIARAYETLNDPQLRAEYDAQQAPKPALGNSSSLPVRSMAERPPQNATNTRAENSFRQGLAAMKENKPDQALRFFAEAASIAPRQGCYRAEYGRALISQAETRRIAEIELKAAISLEPNNASYRVILAELYQALGLHRRAEGEIQRALSTDPKNEAARQFLAHLKK